MILITATCISGLSSLRCRRKLRNTFRGPLARHAPSQNEVSLMNCGTRRKQAAALWRNSKSLLSADGVFLVKRCRLLIFVVAYEAFFAFHLL